MCLNCYLDYDFDTSVTYVGVMSPEENMIVIIQNILLFISSSIGYLLLVPFYQVIVLAIILSSKGIFLSA